MTALEHDHDPNAITVLSAADSRQFAEHLARPPAPTERQLAAAARHRYAFPHDTDETTQHDIFFARQLDEYIRAPNLIAMLVSTDTAQEGRLDTQIVEICYLRDDTDRQDDALTDLGSRVLDLEDAVRVAQATIAQQQQAIAAMQELITVLQDRVKVQGEALTRLNAAQP